MRRATTALVLAAVVSLSALAADVGIETEFAVRSKFVWRGMVLSDGACFQPTVTTSMGDASLNVWASQDLTTVNDDTGGYHELDFLLEYSHETDILGIEGGGVVYTMPNDKEADQTSELFVILTLSGVTGSPTIGIWRDIDNVGGTYASIGGSHEFELTSGATLGVDLTIGFGNARSNRYNFAEYIAATDTSVYDPDTDVQGMTDIAIGASLSKAIVDDEAEGISFGWAVSLAVSTVLDPYAQNASPASNAVLGISFTADF